ncbi:helix-turn-helix domain-containing protein [Cohnella endophytica]|uniref:Helix-turn-helix domain-containing protein n=1 Tax=Cohnella endophytica TaxID=2419778 RepID=A0A494XQR7_9BACL|nr:helix-turn-helix domain-containing protein [Cohnella endophytica]RKP49863.1 helix-turn-helix domain-containing protein [Cohnella endophytica]
MYTVLIIDDEALLCDGVKAKLERAQVPGVAEIHVAYGGLEGLRTATEIRPHIIITDIRMPELDGIELIKRLRGQLPDTRFIMLSGYGEYEYVREAFKYGSQDYLLKPASSAELAAQVRAAIAAIGQGAKEGATVRRRDRTDSDERELLAARLARLVYSEDDSGSGLEETPHREQPLEGPFVHPRFAIALLSLGTSSFDARDVERAGSALRGLIDRNRLGTELKFLAFHDAQGQPCVVFNFADSVTMDEVAELLKTTLASLMPIDERAPAPIASISGPGGPDELAKLYKQALKTMSYRILQESCPVLRYEESSVFDAKDREDEFLPAKKDIEELRHAAETLQLELLGEWIDKWFDDTMRARIPFESFKAMYELMITEVHRHINGRLLPEESGQPIHAFSSFRSLSELRQYAKGYAFQVKQIANERSNLDGTVISVAEAIVREHFGRDLQLAEVANRVSMNYSYFSKLFKERTGLTFTAYLIKVRMEEAHKLLKNPAARINEISEKVGYGNLYHFSRAFKNYYGVSPKEYRKTM